MKVQNDSSLEPPLDESRFAMIFLTILGVNFRLVLDGKIGKDIPESPRLEFLVKFLAHNFVLSDTEKHTSGGGMADLPLLRTILAIRQKS